MQFISTSSTIVNWCGRSFVRSLSDAFIPSTTNYRYKIPYLYVAQWNKANHKSTVFTQNILWKWQCNSMPLHRACVCVCARQSTKWNHNEMRAATTANGERTSEWIEIENRPPKWKEQQSHTDTFLFIGAKIAISTADYLLAVDWIKDKIFHQNARKKTRKVLTRK